MKSFEEERRAEERRKAHARLAAKAGWLKIPPSERAARNQAARDGFLRKFEDQVDPMRRLDPADRARLAQDARTVFYMRLGRASAKARAAKKAKAARNDGRNGPA